MNKVRMLAILGLLGVTIAAMTAADAQSKGKRKNLDTDGDGFITQAEWDSAEHWGDSTFADFDADGDGRISQEEFENRKRELGRDRVRERRY